MSSKHDRRDFIRNSAAIAGTLALGKLGMPEKVFARSAGNEKSQTGNEKTIKLGFVGVGGRGSYHLDVALGIPGVEIPAICDIKDANLYRAKQWIEEAGKPPPRLYNRSETDFRRLCEEEELDAVICATSWEWHVPVCLAAMKNNKHAVTEVPMILTVDDGWEIVETWESTGKWATLALEQVLLESTDGLDVLNMIRQGVFGEILYAENGYIHDLRKVKFDPDHEPWRLQHSVDRNGNLYPDHPMSKIMPYMDINHGDRFDYLVSMSTRSGTLNEYARLNYGPDNYYATKEMAQGDVNYSLIRTVKGKMVNLGFDTNTPHPREFPKIQGTKAAYINGQGLGPRIYIDGQTLPPPDRPNFHKWEPADKYLEQYEHPFLRDYVPIERDAPTRGHGSTKTKTPITWHLLVKALREDKMPWFDVYDSVTSSVISPLSEESVAGRSKAVDFPDFTRGKWETREPIDFKWD
jgi:hypothetical protein